MPTMISDFPETDSLTETEARLARELVQKLERLLESKQADPRFHLQRDGESADPIVLPLSAIRLLKRILAEMAQGHGIAVLPVNTYLTTEQASELLNVSQPYFIGLLDAGNIPFRLVGTDRRVRLGDVTEFKRRDDHDRLKVLEELVAQAQELDMGY